MRFYLHAIFHIEEEVAVYNTIFKGFAQFSKFFDASSPVGNDREMATRLDETVRGLIVEEYDRLREKYPFCCIRPASHTLVRMS